MTITVYANAVDVTTKIKFGSLRKVDVLNSATDSLVFTVVKPAAGGYTPNVNDEIVVYDGATKIFGGVVMSVEHEYDGHSLPVYTVDCKDYVQHLDRRLIVERFENEAVVDIINDLITGYAPGFTTDITGATAVQEVTTFNSVMLSDALNTLAKRLNYFWYVDYDKVVHFFPKNGEAAPFGLTDSSNNYIYDSLRIESDFTQLRNRVLVKGGEAESNVRTEYHSGTGLNPSFALANKYASIPTVTVGGVGKTVGVDGLDSEASFQVMWSFLQKSLKFTTGNIPPSATDNVVVTGIPLLPINVIVSDGPSIATYGVYEYKVEDKRLSTRDDAVAFGEAELAAYKDPIKKVAFQTYTPGLRSGQQLNVNSTRFGINEDFIIQKVSFQMLTQDRGIWNVELATLRTIRMTDLLQKLLREDGNDNSDLEALFSAITIFETFALTSSVTSTAHTSPPYFWENAALNASSNDLLYNFATWT